MATLEEIRALAQLILEACDELLKEPPVHVEAPKDQGE